MAEWNNYKCVRRLYREDGDFVNFAYYNQSYSSQTVELVNMLFEEILKDFPEQSAQNVHLSMLPEFPNEIVLSFSLPKYEVQQFNLSKFRKMPDDFGK